MKYLILILTVLSFSAFANYETIDDYRSSSNYKNYKSSQGYSSNSSQRSVSFSDPSYRVEQEVCLDSQCNNRAQISAGDRAFSIGTVIDGLQLRYTPKSCGEWFNKNCR